MNISPLTGAAITPLVLPATANIQPLTGRTVDALTTSTLTAADSQSSAVDISTLGQVFATTIALLTHKISATATPDNNLSNNLLVNFAEQSSAAQLFVNAFNNFQANNANIAANPLLSSFDSNLLPLLTTQTLSATGQTLLGSLSQIGISLQTPGVTDGTAQFTVNLGALQEAFTSNPTATANLLAQALQALGEVESAALAHQQQLSAIFNNGSNAAFPTLVNTANPVSTIDNTNASTASADVTAATADSQPVSANVPLTVATPANPVTLSDVHIAANNATEANGPVTNPAGNPVNTGNTAINGEGSLLPPLIATQGLPTLATNTVFSTQPAGLLNQEQFIPGNTNAITLTNNGAAATTSAITPTLAVNAANTPATTIAIRLTQETPVNPVNQINLAPTAVDNTTTNASVQVQNTIIAPVPGTTSFANVIAAAVQGTSTINTTDKTASTQVQTAQLPAANVVLNPVLAAAVAAYRAGDGINHNAAELATNNHFDAVNDVEAVIRVVPVKLDPHDQANQHDQSQANATTAKTVRKPFAGDDATVAGAGTIDVNV